MAKPPQLREYQQHGVELFEKLAHPPRHFFTWDMGAGKTIGAFSVVQAYKHKKVLIVCPAIVRGTWLREINKHWPHVDAASITLGMTTKVSKVKDAERAISYAADVQIVSYDLLPHIEAEGWDFIIIDEFHALRSPSSKQSKMVRSLFAVNPEAWALGLSGTPIPNEAKQIWNPVNTFFPDMWGTMRKGFQIPWPFQATFCNKEENEYGVDFFGLREENRERLESEFRRVSYRVTQAEFAKHLPPLFVEPIHLDTTKLPGAVAVDWFEQVRNECPHIGIYTHLRQTARELFKVISYRVPNVFLIDGSMSADERDRKLAEAKALPTSVIIGTTHALKEGISLSFQKAALVVEWVTAVSEVTQFIGRFARQDSTSMAPTRVQFVVQPNDTSRAETLSRRIADIQKLIAPSRADNLASDTFAPNDMSEEAFHAELSRLIESQQKRAALWSPGEDDDDDDE